MFSNTAGQVISCKSEFFVLDFCKIDLCSASSWLAYYYTNSLFSFFCIFLNYPDHDRM